MKLSLSSEGNNGYKFYRLSMDGNKILYFYVFNEKTYLLDTEEKVFISIADNSIIKPIESHDLPSKPETTLYSFILDVTGVDIMLHKETNMAVVDRIYNIKG